MRYYVITGNLTFVIDILIVISLCLAYELALQVIFHPQMNSI